MANNTNAVETKGVNESAPKFLVRVVFAHHVNIHIHNKQTKQVLHVWDANEYKLLLKLIEYVKANGVKKSLRVREIMGVKIYKDEYYDLTMTADQIKSLLVITPRNKNSDTLKKLMKFIGEGEEQ